jgi:Tol biopolymer transport system component
MARTKTVVALGSESSLALYDPARRTETPVGRTWATYPQWSPGDTAIAVSNAADCSIDIANLRTGKTQRLIDFPSRCPRLSDWSPDGRYLVFSRFATDTAPSEIWVHDLPTKQSSILFSGDADYSEGALSPDGKWLAYVSTETGSPEVFVRRFLVPGAPERVSIASGRTPRWRTDGRSLVFITADGRLLETSVITGDHIDVGTARVKFRVNNWARSLFTDIATPYDMSPDASRFVVFGGSQNVAMLDQNIFRALSHSSPPSP